MLAFMKNYSGLADGVPKRIVRFSTRHCMLRGACSIGAMGTNAESTVSRAQDELSIIK